ncbi:DUF397 domain-containing protein [Actinophytocola sp.]|uniref:DUF397 domain-containing protein n=1 Tax=Actinophytocola sp. TaxID=1872138 RepID=UPI002ED5A9D6
MLGSSPDTCNTAATTTTPATAPRPRFAMRFISPHLVPSVVALQDLSTCNPCARSILRSVRARQAKHGRREGWIMTNSRSTIWRKSSYSSGGNAMCVEVSVGAERALVRDSKFAVGPVLGFTSVAWRMFVGDVLDGLKQRRGVVPPNA